MKLKQVGDASSKAERGLGSSCITSVPSVCDGPLHVSALIESLAGSKGARHCLRGIMSLFSGCPDAAMILEVSRCSFSEK